MAYLVMSRNFIRRSVQFILVLLSIFSPYAGLAQEWRWSNPRPSGNEFNCVKGNGSQLLIAGNRGTLLTKEGESWNSIPLDTVKDLEAVWIFDDGQVMVAGGTALQTSIVYLYDGITWNNLGTVSSSTRKVNDLWGTSPDDVFAVTNTNSASWIYHYDGVEWQAMLLTGASFSELKGIWGTSSTDVYVAGGSTIKHYDGDGDNNGQPDLIWENMTVNLAEPYFLTDIYGSNGTLYAVGWSNAGDGQVILKLNGAIWEKENHPGTRTMRGVYGFPSGLWMTVGDNGQILVKNTTQWEQVDSGTSLDLQSVYGVSLNEIYAVGENGMILVKKNNFWRPFYARNGWHDYITDIWFSGTEGYALGRTAFFYYDGNSWYKRQNPIYMRALGGTGINNVFVVGDDGESWHYNGEKWTTLTPSVTSDLNDVWVTGNGLVYACGDDGVFLRHNGLPMTAWTPIDMGISIDFGWCWGSSESDFYFGTESYNRLYHWDGSPGPVDEITPPDCPYYPKIWGASSGTPVFVVGNSGTILRKTTSWETMVSGTSSSLNAITGFASDDVLAVGDSGTLLSYDGAWQSLDTGSIQAFSDVSKDINQHIFITGPGGLVLKSSPYTGIPDPTWEHMAIPVDDYPSLNAVWGNRWGNLYAVGAHHRIYHFNGFSWQALPTLFEDPDAQLVLYDVWGIPSSNGIEIFTGGGAQPGTKGILHFDGTQWREMNDPTGRYVYGITGNAASDVYAVKGEGTILHYDGNLNQDWVAMDSPTTNWLYDVWTSNEAVFAVGSQGTVVSLSAGVWGELVSPTAETFYVIFGFSSNDFFVGGSAETIYHYKDGTWIVMDANIDQYSHTIMGLWGTSADDMYATTSSGRILHYDGNPSLQWLLVDFQTEDGINHLMGLPTGEMVAVGNRGLILQFDSRESTIDLMVNWPTNYVNILDILSNLFL